MSNCTEISRLSPELEKSRKAFDRLLPELSGKFPAGYYAVFVGAVFLGAYPQYSEALERGYLDAGDAEFLVKQINCEDEIQYVVSSISVDA